MEDRAERARDGAGRLPCMEPVGPPLPPWKLVDLAGRGHGRLQVRDFGTGADGAPPVVLLHGWTATADLNWFTAYPTLGRHFRVVAFDQRGHGRGLRVRGGFRLSACADDAIAVADALGIDRFIAVGYSMGGAVAQLTWKHHPDRVAGLVLCATARRFSRSTAGERMMFGGLLGLSMAARMTPPAVRSQAVQSMLRRRSRLGIPGDLGDWAMDEVRRHDPAAILQAGAAIGSFDSRPWIGGVERPAAVVMSTEDHLVSPRSQLNLAGAIPGARLYQVRGDHDMCVANARQFVPALLDACQDVSVRAGAGTSAGRQGESAASQR